MIQIALSLLLFILAPGKTPGEECKRCDNSSTPGTIECGRCEGKGERLVNCGRCSGKRKLACFYCRGKGKWTCAACGGRTMIHWKDGEKDPCKLCKRQGRVNCPVCQGSKQINCPTCELKGKVTVPCGACLGLGRFPCPDHPGGKGSTGGPGQGACPACQGTTALTCYNCSGTGKFFKPCKKCLDTGQRFCGDCTFLGVSPCTSCYGTGKVRFVYEGGGGKAGAKKCVTCSGKGYRKCAQCKNGMLKCDLKPESTEYETCSKRGEIKCPLCSK